MLASSEIKREAAFTMRMDPHSSTMVQGIIDCTFKENGEWILIDYKTDHIKNISQLAERYSRQLQLYRHGAKQLFGTDKIKCILYSFHLDEYIEV